MTTEQRHLYYPNRCPVCEARIRTRFCSYTCREAHKTGITRSEQLELEMSRRPWAGPLYFRHHIDLFGTPELLEYRTATAPQFDPSFQSGLANLPLT
jgi:hypothetical protein